MASREAREAVIKKAAQEVRNGGIHVRRTLPNDALSPTPKSWKILVCPDCGIDTLPPGAFRTRCSKCNCFFATQDERPEDRVEDGWWWQHYGHQYARAGKTIEVVACNS